MNDYFVLHLQNVNDQAEAWLSSQAFAFGALGMSEALSFQQPEGEEDVFLKHPATRAVDVFFQTAPPVELVKQIEKLFPSVKAQVKGEANKDWLAEWKKGFEPFALTEKYWVVPSWCQSPVAADCTIRIDPGMAFGTGTHETTKLVARELEQLGSHSSLLDVGTGTGILAILAARMGFKQVTGTEIEEDSRRVAQENFALNGVNVSMDQRQVGELNGTFDVVVANIIDGVLVRIQDDLKSRVKPGGWLVVSGIILEREQDFLKGFNLPVGVAWRRRDLGDWLLFSAKF